MDKDFKLKEKYGLYINGEFRDASDGKTFDVTCPADGRHLTVCAEATKEDVDAAVKGAQEAFKEWRKTSDAERTAILNKLADLITENREYLATLEALDTGRPFRETFYSDMVSVPKHIRYYASYLEGGEESASVLDGRYLSVVLREPLGVVGCISPWNFPFLLSLWKIAPALAAGDCVIMKPSSATSLSVLGFAELTKDILPPGVLQVITGSGSKAGQYILDHEGIVKLAFTGSTDVGYQVAEAAAKKLIPATLELGGKSANIYFDDCDFDKAIDGLTMGILLNAGQMCFAGSRVFVQDTFYDKFIEAATERFNRVRLGLPWDAATQMGSLNSEGHAQKVMSYIELAKKEGARIACGGKRATEGVLANGAFVEPTLIVDVDNKMRIAQEEIFGPVACVIKFHDEEEVIDMANDSIYGLAGAVWTKDIYRALRVARAVETGRMWINTYTVVPIKAPFGGCKKSGYGRESYRTILDAYSRTKNIMIDTSTVPTGLFP